ncbi:rhamnulose-1-phosphate aldolase, partial [Salmonella enterica]
ERKGGNLTLRLDEDDIAPFSTNFHEKTRYIALRQPKPLLANTPYIVTGTGKIFSNVHHDPEANISEVKIERDEAGNKILRGITNDT